MRRGLLDIAERDSGVEAAEMKACCGMCGLACLVIPARRVTRRTTRAAPRRASRRPSAARNSGPKVRSLEARSIVQ